jgi:hypothetical protein
LKFSDQLLAELGFFVLCRVKLAELIDTGAGRMVIEEEWSVQPDGKIRFYDIMNRT